jgi:hypothetical protein
MLTAMDTQFIPTFNANRFVLAMVKRGANYIMIPLDEGRGGWNGIHLEPTPLPL